MAAHKNTSKDQFGEQLQLFDPATTRAQDPGEQSMDKWLEHPDVSYHGSFREDWNEAPISHFGDVKAATQRLGFVAGSMARSPIMAHNYYSGETSGDYDDWEEPEEDITHTGRVYARRLNMAPQKQPLGDTDANIAHVKALQSRGYEDWEVPASISDSVRGANMQSQRATRAARVLNADRKGLSYRNDVEAGDTGISQIVPREASRRSWESDVIESPFSSPTARNFARQRMASGQEGSVSFEAPREKDVPQLKALHEGGTSEQLTFGGGYQIARHKPVVSAIQFVQKAPEYED